MKIGTVGSIELHVLMGDITNLSFEVDVIVNAANEKMLGGGGVDGAIHRAAGIKLFEVCQKFPTDSSGVRCKWGEVKVTRSYGLSENCFYIFHTVAPRYKFIEKEQAAFYLDKCYSNSIQEAYNRRCFSIAFPCLGTGVFEYPFEEATNVALLSFQKNSNFADKLKVFLVCFTPEDFDKMHNIASSYVEES